MFHVSNNNASIRFFISEVTLCGNSQSWSKDSKPDSRGLQSRHNQSRPPAAALLLQHIHPSSAPRCRCQPPQCCRGHCRWTRYQRLVLFQAQGRRNMILKGKILCETSNKSHKKVERYSFTPPRILCSQYFKLDCFEETSLLEGAHLTKRRQR